MKNRRKSIVSLFIIILFTLTIFVNINYLSENSLNRVDETKYDIYYTYEYSRKGNHITAIRTPHYTPTDPFTDLPPELKPIEIEEEQESIKLGLTPPPYEPPQLDSTGDKDYLIEPTDFTDTLSHWTNEIDAYDWNNATNADCTISGDNYNLELHTWNTTDNSGETITYVDIYMRADWSISANDYATVEWYVGATQGSGTFQMNSGNAGSDQIISFENVADPVDASWSWTDIANIKVIVDLEKVTGADTVVYGIDEVWGWVDVEGAVQDTTDPDISSPADQEVEFGATGNLIEWTVGDQNPNNYILYRNSSNVESGPWTNGTIDADSSELDGLAVGFYNLTLWIDDDSGNDASDEVIFQVSDTTAPVLDSPANDQYNEGSTSNLISWTVSELSPNDYIVYKNESVYDSGVYSNGIPIDIDIDGQSLGTYNFTMWVDDDYGYEDTDEVIITVVDGTNPSLDSPSNVQYSEGSTSNIVTWTVIETNPDKYEVWQNGTPWDSGSYSSGVGIQVNVDGLSLGFYNFTIRVNDTTNNFATDEVIVEVYDGTDPILDSPSNVDYELGSTSNLLTWLASDTNANNYTVYKNGTIWSTYDSQSWTSGIGIEINLDGLAVGFYNFTILVHDVAYNGDSDEVIVHVTDTTDPLIDSPIDDSIELGSSIDDITWTGNDLSADTYEVFKNSSSWDSGNWEDSIPIVVELDTLPLGLWNFTIILYDSSGNSVTDLVWITCEDTTNPEINSPSDQENELGSTNNELIWLSTDLDADIYICYKNETEYDTDSWVTSVNIIIQIDSFPLGLWNMTIIVFDGSGNNVIDLIWVTISDSTNPQINSPADDEYTFGSTSNTIVWVGIDLDADLFEVFKNSSTHDSGPWVTSVNIIINIDGFVVGLFNLTIIIWDGTGNFIVDLVWITVSEASNDPVIHSVIPGVNITIEKGSETTITVNVTTVFTMNDVSIWYKINIAGIWHNISLTYDPLTELYTIGFASGAIEGDIIFYYIKAVDNQTNWSVSQDWQFNVILPEDKEDPWIHDPNTDEPNTDWSEIAIKAILIIFGAMVIFGVFVYLLSDYARKIK